VVDASIVRISKLVIFAIVYKIEMKSDVSRVNFAVVRSFFSLWIFWKISTRWEFKLQAKGRNIGMLKCIMNHDIMITD
jgi:hypothetical protein